MGYREVDKNDTKVECNFLEEFLDILEDRVLKYNKETRFMNTYHHFTPSILEDGYEFLTNDEKFVKIDIPESGDLAQLEYTITKEIENLRSLAIKRLFNGSKSE